MRLSIRDPLHGTIEIQAHEQRLLAHRALRRLRDIQQLGFSVQAYPGASHSRFIHSVGAMWVATQMWDTLQQQLPFPQARLQAYGRLLRAAVLLHDIGHAPFSHCTEALMPSVDHLDLAPWLPTEQDARQAHHEDYTLKLLLDSSLTPVLEAADLQPTHIAQLISGQRRHDDQFFWVDDHDLFPIMRQIVSSELDADRMDYLLRDSLFTGVAYGKYDLDWLIRNLQPIQQQQRVHMGLKSRAIAAFEDFLLSRYHMFFSVYYHHASVCYQAMLQRFFAEAPTHYQIPTDAESYLSTDDVQFMWMLRQSNHPWAKRIVEQRPFHKLLELQLPTAAETPCPPDASTSGTLSTRLHNSSPYEAQYRLQFSQQLCARLDEAGIEHLVADEQWRLSHDYPRTTSLAPSLYVRDEPFDQAVPIELYSPLYQRYADSTRLLYIFVIPQQLGEARSILQQLGGPAT